jgi:hypothetical protein
MVEAIMAAFRQPTVLANSRAVVISNTLPRNTVDGARLKGGDKIAVPYFESIGQLDDVDEDHALTPAKLTTTDEEASLQHSGKMVEMTHWARIKMQYADPYAEVARQFRAATQEKFDAKLMSAASTSLPSGNVLDVYDAGTPRYLDWDLLVDGAMLFGDQQAGIEMMVVDSTTLGRLRKLKDGIGRPLLEVKLNPGTGEFELSFQGIPIRVSDSETVVGGQHKTRIYKRGSLALWINEEPRVLEDTDISKDNELIALHVYYVVHRYKRLPATNKPGVVEIIHN